MRQLVLTLVLGLGLMVLPQNTFAQEGHEGHEHMHSAMEAAEAAAPAAEAVSDASAGQAVAATDSALEEVGNPICPVSGEKVGEMGETVKYEYNGKVYNLCCPMCKKDFDKDPEKFSKKAEDQMMEEKITE